MSQYHIRTCAYCHKQFMAIRADAQYCPDNSTCRTGANRARARSRKEQERLTVSLEQHALYEVITGRVPEVAGALNQMIAMHGKDAFNLLLVAMAILMERSHGKSDGNAVLEENGYAKMIRYEKKEMTS